MFALLAAIIWLLAAFHVALGSVDMMFLGLALLALHFALSIAMPVPATWRSHQ